MFWDGFNKQAEAVKMRATPKKHGGSDGRNSYKLEKKDGKWSCSCPDFMYRRRAAGEECKHIQAHKKGKMPWELKKVAETRKQVSTVGIFQGDKILMGVRHDTGKWTNPGGHLDNGESPEAGAKREALEESGIELDKVQHLETRDVTTPKGQLYRIHAYKASVPEGTHTSMKNDPDLEVKRWHWVKTPLAEEILSKLHSPDNVLLQALHLQEKKKEAA